LKALETIGTKVCDDKFINEYESVNIPKSMELQTDSDISINKGTYKEINNCKDNETLVIEKTGIVDILISKITYLKVVVLLT